ncbi:membrane protein insertion efficiency factor YidD [bacterium]|nr:membrane protein insertion efficiency factor YidD [bacterium]
MFLATVLLFFVFQLPVAAIVPMPGEAKTWSNTVAHNSRFDESMLTNPLLHWYQHQSARTVSRCPFKTSCSRYALVSFETKGPILGLLFFIDRHYFREHRYVSLYYRPALNTAGQKRLDDDFFLTGE